MFGVIYSIILNWKINQTYPWLKADVALGRKVFKKYPEVMTKTKQIFFHKIGSFFQFQISPILIYTYSSLSLVALYQNYTLITSKISGFFSNLLVGMSASIGNLIAEGNRSKILDTFWELFSLQFFIAGLICAPIYILIDPFISLWLGDKYILEHSTLFLILVTTFIQCTRSIVDNFNSGYGLFWDIWSPIVESVVLLVFGVICGALWGINGVLLGPLASLILVISLWKPILLFKWGIKSPIYNYWIGYVKNIGCVLLPLFITICLKQYIILNPSSNFINWAIYSIIVTAIYAMLSYITFLIFTNGMRTFNKRISAQITNSKIFKIWQFRK
jgi:O-antigen/teichoic acid export membrane protein